MTQQDNCLCWFVYSLNVREGASLPPSILVGSWRRRKWGTSERLGRCVSRPRHHHPPPPPATQLPSSLGVRHLRAVGAPTGWLSEVPRGLSVSRQVFPSTAISSVTQLSSLGKWKRVMVPSFRKFWGQTLEL